MSEQTPETPAPVAPEATQEQPQEPAPQPEAPESPEDTEQEQQTWDPERAKEKIRKINSENRTLRERATEAEKKAETVPDLEQQNSTLGSENLRLKVGYELGLPYNLAVRLQGSTREEMVADAESLVSLVTANKPASPPAATRPVEALKPGASPAEQPALGEAEYPSHWFPKIQRGS